MKDFKKFKTTIVEGADLRCHNCGDNLGKAKENSKRAYCGSCGSTTTNPAGYNNESASPVTKKPALESSKHPNLKDGIKNERGRETNYTIHIQNLSTKKVLDHGKGIVSVTSKYAPHQAKKFDDEGSPKYPGVHHSITHVYHLEQNDKERYPKGWDDLNAIGQIHHTRMPDGIEHHTIIHGHGS